MIGEVAAVLGWVLFYVTLVVGLALIPLGLGGTFIIVADALLLGLATQFERVGVWAVVTIAVLAVVGEILEAWLGVFTARRFGGSRWAMVGTFAGGVLGAIAGAPVMPVVGPLAGAFLGAFLGAFVAEVIYRRRVQTGLRAGWGAFLGRVLAAVLKLEIGMVMVIIILVQVFGSRGGHDPAPGDTGGMTAAPAVALAAGNEEGDRWVERRERMVRETIVARGVRDSLVLEAMRAVPRHRFVPEAFRERSYADHPLPIAAGQTISQPYIVALMTELLELEPGERVLEIGTGSGYQAAVLAEITGEVFSIEIVEELGKTAAALLDQLGYAVEVRIGDGYRGWPEHAPFDAIIVTAAPDHIPRPLVDQLATGGRLVIPVGDREQHLLRLTRQPDGSIEEERVIPVRFVPMTGEAEDP